MPSFNRKKQSGFNGHGGKRKGKTQKSRREHAKEVTGGLVKNTFYPVRMADVSRGVSAQVAVPKTAIRHLIPPGAILSAACGQDRAETLQFWYDTSSVFPAHRTKLRIFKDTAEIPYVSTGRR